MKLHELAGKPAPQSMLENIPRLIAAYYTYRPDVSQTSHLIAFGTSGHRGWSMKNSFNEDHILAVSQAICEYRKVNKINAKIAEGHRKYIAPKNLQENKRISELIVQIKIEAGRLKESSLKMER